MINIDIIIKIFINYAKNFDLKNPNIMRKFHHSFRVMEYANEIAKSQNLSEKDIILAHVIGLFHDIARFEQWTKYQTYKDDKSIDHGNLGVEIITKFMDEITSDLETQKIILIAIRNHNKFRIEDGLNEKQLLMAKIIRDADKIDIMKEQGNIIQEQFIVNEQIVNVLENKELLKNNLVTEEQGNIFRLISFIFDFNFKYTYKYILNHNIIQNKINLLEIYSNSDLSNLEDELITYLKERCE